EEARMLAKEKLTAAKARIDEKLAESKLLREERRAETKLIQKQKLAEAKALRKQKLEEAKQKRLIKKTQPVTTGELIFGTSAGIIFGLLLIIQPFSVTGLMLPAFLDWLKLLGFLIFVSGLLDLIRLVIGVSNYTGQQVFLIIGAFYSLSFIPVFLLLLNQPEIFPISLFSGGNIPIIPSDPSNVIYIVYFWVIIIIIIGIIGGMIGNFVKVGRYSKLKKVY
ncbi:MAG: cell envelope integrity protein TolA, partial [Promethearchaeota archaeon]